MNESEPYVGTPRERRLRAQSAPIQSEPTSRHAAATPFPGEAHRTLDKTFYRRVVVLPFDGSRTIALWHGMGTRGARRISVTREDVESASLPPVFDGMTFAFLTDLHCSVETPPGFLEKVIAETNALQPDFILLGGDYVTEGTEYLAPVTELLAKLHAPLGVYGVLGNHDHTVSAQRVRECLERGNCEREQRRPLALARWRTPANCRGGRLVGRPAGLERGVGRGSSRRGCGSDFAQPGLCDAATRPAHQVGALRAYAWGADSAALGRRVDHELASLARCCRAVG